jgi:hypothetical protein
MASKIIFHKFSNDIYPTSIVVAICNSEWAINNEFMEEDKSDIKDLPQQSTAFVISVVERKTKERVDLIIFRHKHNMDIGTMCHEAFHATLRLCKKYGIDIDESNNEAASYLLEWVVGCIDQVRTGKFK